jgi:hypothetical protein
MKLEYKVHSVARDKSPITVSHKGKDREVLADVLTVELVNDASVLTLRLDDVEEAEKLFGDPNKPAKAVTLTIAKGK